MNNNSNQVAATIATMVSGVDWEKLDSATLQVIQRGFQRGGAGEALIRWLQKTEWMIEPAKLIQLGYRDWVKERLTPGIDDEEPFTEGTLMQLAPILHPGENFAIAVYYHTLSRAKNRFSLWSCVGLQTLEYLSKNPLPDFANKRIIAWKSAVSDGHGANFVPACYFKAEDDGIITAEPIEWLDFRRICRPIDHTLRIHA